MSKIKECLTLADKCENPRAVSFKMAVERLERTADNILVQDFWKLFLILGLALHVGSLLKMAGRSMLCCVMLLYNVM